MPDASPHEIVLLYDAEEEIQEDFLFSDFESILAGEAKLDGVSAGRIRAAYCLIGNGLVLRSVVFFTFKVDDAGQVEASFNLPLRYMALHAGKAEDVGKGPVRKASRAQCPVPWHSVNMWEPGESGIEMVQKRVYRNKLKLKPAIIGCDDSIFTDDEEEITRSDESIRIAQSEVAPQDVHSKAHQVNARLAELFGDAGKLSLQDLIRLHADQLDLAQAKYREDIENQQSAYLDQLRAAREEIHQLKVALRQEQGRNRRLQQMLRGDL